MSTSRVTVQRNLDLGLVVKSMEMPSKFVQLSLKAKDRNIGCRILETQLHVSTEIQSVMDIGYFSYFLSLYLLDKETQCNTYLNPCSEFILKFLDIIYSQMTPIHKQSFLLKLEPLLEPLPFRLCLIQ